VRDTESRYWEHVTAGCMTEESDDENGEKIVTHQLLWRSECEFSGSFWVAVHGVMHVCVRVCERGAVLPRF